MNTEDTLYFFNLLKSDNHCLLYNGSFVDSITTKVIELSEINLNYQSEVKKVQKRVSHLTAECFQNIIRHGGYKEHEVIENNAGFFMSRNTLNRYFIASGNLIANNKVEELKTRLDLLNSSSADELKALHREVITKGEMSEKGGAGLGLIDMARKSGNKFSYQFIDYNTDKSMFYNQVNLKSEVEGTHVDETDIEVGFAVALHKKMIEQDIVMLHKGDLSKASVIPLLNIIENNIEHKLKGTSLVKNIFELLAELLQNISRHAYSNNDFTEGIFLISKSNNTYSISSGNYIENEKIDSLNDHIKSLNSMSNSELHALLVKNLELKQETNEPQMGVGLIDISSHLKEKIEYSFKKINEKLSFFTINLSYHE